MIKNLRPILWVACVVTVGVLVFALSSRASVVENIDIPISGIIVNPCNGENVAFNGIDHVTLSLTFTRSGGFHADVHENIHVTATGDQGNSYVGNQEDKSVVNGQVGFETTFTNSFSEISKGSAPNFEVYEVAHLTVNADGTVTASFDHFTAVCRG
jgi:hypothetical protein